LEFWEGQVNGLFMAYIFSSAALLISVVSFFIIFFYVKARTRADRIPPETRQEAAKIINEIDRITDRDSELIEARVKNLKSLLEDVDRRIAFHEGLTENYRTAEEIKKKLSTEKQDAAIAVYRKLGKENYASEGPFIPQPLNVAVTENETVGIASGETTTINEQNLIRKAAALSASGVPNHEIAKRLHTTVNEVEMALFLASTNS
jgi:predicted ATP-dependent protease